jgi:hypothetical protein
MEKSLYAAGEEEQNEVIQKGAEARTEQEVIGAEAISPTAEEDQETVTKEKVQKQKHLKKKEKVQKQKHLKKEDTGHRGNNHNSTAPEIPIRDFHGSTHWST